MHASTKQFGRGRATGLVLIALVALGLGYLHFSGGSDPVSVPSGAHAGQLTLESCTYANEPADCGSLVVRENRHDPDSRLIALPITRVRAHSAHAGAPIFRLQGGPGITNMDFPDAARFASHHDVVLVGYRGIDGSSRLDCPEVVSAREHSRDLLSEATFASVATGFRACADRLRAEGVDLAGYSIPERVDDLERARRALGYRQIDLVSESAGTRTAMIYAWRYPKSIHRSVMVAVNPPGHFVWDAKTTGEQVRRYAALCASDESCRGRTPDFTRSMHSAFEHIPRHWWFLPIKQGNVQAASFFGLMNATKGGGGPLASPLTIDTLLSADEGDGGGAWLLSLAAAMTFPRAQVWGDVASIGRADHALAKQFFATGGNKGSVIGSPGTDLIWAGGKLVNAWPANPDENEYTHVQDSSVPTLLIGGQLDFATPPQVAHRELLPHLENGREVVLPKIGHADDFWAYEPAASTRLIDAYLESGRVDTSLYTVNRLDLTPSMTQGRIAEIVLAVLLGFAALTVLSFVWIATRIRRRAEFGRKSSFMARALLPIVLGFGGWCLGVLIVLVAFPTVPITDQVLAVVSIAPPVALGVYAGWFRRAALGGVAAWAALSTAMLGAWLGYHVPHAPGLGAVTAIIAATLAANLGLIVLDVATNRVVATADEPSAPHADSLPGPA